MRGAATAGTGPTKRAPMSRGRGHDSTRPRVGGVVALFALLLIELLAAGFGVSTRPACCCRSRWRPRCTRRPGPSCPGDRHAGGAAAGTDRGVAGLPGLPGRPALPNVSPAANLGRSGVWTGECRDADWCRSDRPASGLLDQPPSAPRFGALRGRPVKCAASTGDRSDSDSARRGFACAAGQCPRTEGPSMAWRPAPGRQAHQRLRKVQVR